MRHHLQRLAHFTVGHSIQAILGPILTLIQVPLLTRALGTDLYGLADLILMTGSILLSLALLGLNSAINAFYTDSADLLERRRVAAATLSAGLLSSLLLAVVVMLLANPIARVINHPELANMVRVTMVTQVFAVIYLIQQALLRLKMVLRYSNLLIIAFLLLNFGSLVIYVVVLKRGLWGVVLANLTTYGFCALLGLIFAPESILTRPQWPKMREIARTGAVLVPATLANWALMYEDRVFLAHFVTKHELGIYAMAARLASILVVMLTPFQAAWLPVALEMKDSPQAPRTYSKVLVYAMVGTFTIALGLSLFSHEVLALLSTPEFYPAQSMIWLLTLTAIASVWHYVVAIGLYITKKLRGVMVSTLAGAAVNTILNIVLIPFYGTYGAMIATAIAYVASGIVLAWFAQQVYPLPFAWSKIIWVFGCFLGVGYLGTVVENSVTLPSLALRGALLIGFLGLVLVGRVFEPWELKLARQALRQPSQLLGWLRRRES